MNHTQAITSVSITGGLKLTEKQLTINMGLQQVQYTARVVKVT